MCSVCGYLLLLWLPTLLAKLQNSFVLSFFRGCIRLATFDYTTEMGPNFRPQMQLSSRQKDLFLGDSKLNRQLERTNQNLILLNP
jgi:hypothetical protein